MKYRDFGKNGQKISQLGFGTMRLPEFEKDGKWYIDEEKAIPMLRRAYELGVNYFDTAVMYCHDNSQYTVGKAIKPFRDKIMLSTKLPMGSVHCADDFDRILGQSLERIDTPYIDYYHFHALNLASFEEQVEGYGLMKRAQKAMDEGLIRHISFSFHDDPEKMKTIIDRGEIFSSVTMQYNLLDRSNEKMLEYAHSKGLGTVIMGPVAGGRLSAPSMLGDKLLGKQGTSTPEVAMRFVLGNPNVSCALSGMTSLEMVEENAGFGDLDASMTEEDHIRATEMMEQIKKFSDLYCTGCSYCMPCPAGIDIPYIFKCYTYYNVYGLKDHARQMYSEVGAEGGHHGKIPDVCLKCGKCKAKCPQHINIPEKLADTAKVLSEVK